MASLGNFLQGYETARQGNLQADTTTLQQAGVLQKLFAQQQADQNERRFRSEIATARTPEERLQIAQKYMGPDKLGPSIQSSQDRAAALEAANINRAAARDQAAALQAERLAAQAEIARQRAEDMRLSQAERNQARVEMVRLAASLRPAPAQQPLVPIVGPDGKPRLATREEAVGATPWAAGSAQDKKQEQVESGRETVNSLVATLRDQYEQLGKAGGITDPQKGVVSNIGAGIASSGAGQFAGRVFGTQNQSLRNQIIQQRPLLLNAIKQATGMSAKQMDSNAELKLYLAASTDPTLDIKSNLAALDKIDELYGLGGKQSGAGGVPAGIDPKVWAAMTPQEKALWKK